jgi:pyruvate kinase
MRRTKIVCTIGPATRSAEVGDVLVIVAGAPLWVRGTTTLIRLHRVERQG